MININKNISENPDHTLKVYDNLIDLIASPENPTPLVKLDNSINNNEKFPIYLKLEWYNPFGSIKDRIAIELLKNKTYNKDRVLIAASSGNLGLSYSGIANYLNIENIEIAISKKAPEEKKEMLQSLLKVNLWDSDDDICPSYPHEGARGIVNGLITSKGGQKYIFKNQFENEENVKIHYNKTGPEIWKQTKGKIDYFFCPIETGGTLMGVGRFLKEKNPSIKIIGIESKDPNFNIPGLKHLSGLEDVFIPNIINKEKRKDLGIILEGVEEKATYLMTIKLIRKGYFISPSSGAAINVALKYAEKGENGYAVTIAPDNTFKYINLIKDFVEDPGDRINC